MVASRRWRRTNSIDFTSQTGAWVHAEKYERGRETKGDGHPFLRIETFENYALPQRGEGTTDRNDALTAERLWK